MDSSITAAPSEQTLSSKDTIKYLMD